MTDAFAQVLDDVGEEIFGLQWLAFRPLVQHWVNENPERVKWLCHRIRQSVEEGRL